MTDYTVSELLEPYDTHWGRDGLPYEEVYRQADLSAAQRLHQFVKETPDCFKRELPVGHVTGSALVTSPDFSKVLLTLHAKLGKWLQLGGHADGDANIPRVALREAEEESGLAGFKGLSRLDGSPILFDVDIHDIPARKSEPQHLHYDMRFLLIHDPAAPIIQTAESKDLKWLDLDEAFQVTDEWSMRRQFLKLKIVADAMGTAGSPFAIKPFRVTKS